VTAPVPYATVLEAIGVTKTFGGTVALAGVDVRLEAGRVHAIIGENGAGKSTLMKVLAGIERPTTGMLRLDGAEVRFADAHEAAARGIELIHQELRLFPDLTVAENLFVGRERLSRWGTVAWRQQERVARDVLGRLGHGFISPTARVGALPLGQQQIVEIARALVDDTRVLLMDEPTSALTSAEIPVLFDVIRDLARHGVAIVYISHRLEELLAIADVVTVLRDGRVAGEAPAAAVDVGWIVERMTGRRAAELKASPAPPGDAVVLEVRGLRLPARPGRTGLRDVSFAVRAGEVLGLYGLMGAGRTELLESLLGVHGDATGAVRLSGRDLRWCDIAERVAAGLAMVPEDRQAAGLVPTLSVRENITLSMVGRLAVRGYLSPRVEADAAAPLVAELRVKTPGLDAPVTALSGGNQQKVVLARGVMSRPAVLLLDEPTRGVDVGAKFEILEAMRRLAADGLAVLFATSDLVDVQAAATRVLVMAGGRITADVPAESASADALASAASALPPRDGGPDAGA
jgi:erythritol transport system ATP-binding protein